MPAIVAQTDFSQVAALSLRCTAEGGLRQLTDGLSIVSFVLGMIKLTERSGPHGP